MGEAYRGLTIRIGADVTKLQDAMRTTTTAINNVQTQLRLMDKAMRLDPTSLVVASERMGLFGDKAVNTAKQLEFLRQEERQLKAEGIEQMIAKTGNLEANLAKAQNAYNRINEELASIRVEMEVIANKNKIAFPKGHVERVADEISHVSEEAAALVRRYDSVRSKWHEVEDNFTVAKQMAGFSELQTRIIAARTEVESYAKEYTKLKIADEVIAGIRLGVTELEKKTRMAGEAFDYLENEAKQIDRVLKVLPDNIEAMAMKTRNVQERVAMLNEQADALREKIALMASKGIKADGSTRNIVLNAKMAKEEFELVVQQLSEADGKARTLEDLIEKCAESETVFRAKAEGANAALAEARTRVTQVEASLARCREELNKARTASEHFASQLRVSDQNVERLSSSLSAAVEDERRLKAEAADYAKQIRNGVGDIAKKRQLLAEVVAEWSRAKASVQSYTYQLDRAKDLSSQLASNLSKSDARIGRLTEREDMFNQKLDYAANKAQNIAQQLESWNGKISTNGKEAEKYKVELEKVINTIERLRAEEEKAQTAAGNKQALVDLRAAEVLLSEITAKVEMLTKAELAAGSAAKKTLTGLTSLGTTLSYTLSPAVMMAGMYFVHFADDVDSAFRDMKKTVEGTEEQFLQLKNNAIEFSKTHITSARDILEIEAMGGQLGINVEALESFAKVVSDLDIATDINAEDAAKDLGQLSNILDDLNAGTFQNFGDALVRLGNNNAALESSILNITDRAGSMGSILGMTTPQILGWSTAIASTGQGSEAAGTAFSRTMSQIEDSVAKGGDKLELFAEVSGMSAKEFARTWNENPSDALQRFVEGLAQVDKDGGSVNSTLTNLGINGVRQKQMLEGLVQMTDTMSGSQGVLTNALKMSQDAWDGIDDAWGDAGDAAREAQNKSEGFSGALGMLRNSVAALGVEVGDGLLPYMRMAAVVINGASTVFKSMPPFLKSTAVGFGLVTVAIGPLLRGVGAFLANQDKLVDKLKNTSARLEDASGRYSKMSAESIKLATGARNAASAQNTFSAATARSNVALAAMSVRTTMCAAASKALAAASTAAAIASRALEIALPIIGIVSLIGVLGSAVVGLLSMKDANESLADSNAMAGNSIQSVADKMKDLINEEDELRDKLSNVDDGPAVAYDDLGRAIEGASEETFNLSKRLGENLKQQENVSKVLTDSAKKTIALSSAFNDLKGATDVSAEQLNKYASRLGTTLTLEEYQSYVKKRATEATQESTEAMAAAAESLGNLIDSNEMFSLALDASGMSTEQFLDHLQLLGLEVEDITKGMDAMSEKVSDAFNKMELNEENSLDAAIANLDNNIGLTNQWADNMAWLYQRLGDNIDNVFMQRLLSGGVDEYGFFLQQLRDGADESGNYIVNGMSMSFDEIVAKFGEAGDAGKFAYLAEIGLISEEQAAVLQEAADAASDSASSGGEESGEEFVDSYQAAIAEGADKAEAAATVLGEAATNALSGIADEAYTSGQNFAQGFANGISSNSGIAAIMARELGTKAVNELKDAIREGSPSKLTTQSGMYFGQGFGLGIKEEYNYVKSMAEGLANVSLAALGSVSRSDVAGMASNLVGNLSNMVSERSSRAVNVNVQSPSQAGNTYIIQNIDFTGDSDIEGAMLTIFNKMQRLGAM